MKVGDIYLKFDWDGQQVLASLAEVLEKGVPKMPGTNDYMKLMTEEVMDSDGNPLRAAVIIPDDVSADRHDRRARSIARSLRVTDRMMPVRAHSKKETPFAEELARNATEFLVRARAGQGANIRISLSSAVQLIALPRATAGAPAGGNRAWQFRRMLMDAILHSPQWMKEDTLLP